VRLEANGGAAGQATHGDDPRHARRLYGRAHDLESAPVARR
jgi:hypothetical protein